MRCGGPWLDVGTSLNTAYITWDDPTVPSLYHTVVHVGCHNANGIGGTDSDPVVEAMWNEFTDCEVHRVWDNRVMAYSHAGGTSATADQMLSHPRGEGQCTAWADLWTQVVEAQGIGATSTRIDRDFC